MLDLATEKATLARAERDIVEGEARIAGQVALVSRLRKAGQDLTLAETLLATLRGTLQQWQNHRDEILRTIARLEHEAGTTAELRPHASDGTLPG